MNQLPAFSADDLNCMLGLMSRFGSADFESVSSMLGERGLVGSAEEIDAGISAVQMRLVQCFASEYLRMPSRLSVTAADLNYGAIVMIGHLADESTDIEFDVPRHADPAQHGQFKALAPFFGYTQADLSNIECSERIRDGVHAIQQALMQAYRVSSTDGMDFEVVPDLASTRQIPAEISMSMP